jgi:hypothetical protein
MEAAVAEIETAVVLQPPPPVARAGPAGAGRWWLIGGMAVVGGLLGFLGGKYGASLMLPVPSRGYRLWALAALPFVWLVVVGWHELGHLVGGWLGRGRFLLWVVGPFMIRRTPAGVRLAWNRNVNSAGGMAACLPLEPDLLTPRRVAMMVLAGPVASVVLAVAALWIAVALASGPGVVPPGRAVLQHLAVITAGMSALIFAVTAWPSVAGGFKSDGRRAWELLRGGRRSDQEAALIGLTMAGLGGTRPRDSDRALVERAVMLQDGSLFDVYGHLSAYLCAADGGDWRRAQACLDYVVAHEARMVPLLRDTARCEYAWLLATQARAGAVARAWLDTAGRLDFDPATRWRAEAAVLLAENKPEAALEAATKGLHALQHKSLSPVKNAFAADALEAIRREAEAVC